MLHKTRGSRRDERWRNFFKGKLGGSFSQKAHGRETRFGVVSGGCWASVWVVAKFLQAAELPPGRAR